MKTSPRTPEDDWMAACRHNLGCTGLDPTGVKQLACVTPAPEDPSLPSLSCTRVHQQWVTHYTTVGQSDTRHSDRWRPSPPAGDKQIKLQYTGYFEFSLSMQNTAAADLNIGASTATAHVRTPTDNLIIIIIIIIIQNLYSAIMPLGGNRGEHLPIFAASQLPCSWPVHAISENSETWRSVSPLCCCVRQPKNGLKRLWAK